MPFMLKREKIFYKLQIVSLLGNVHWVFGRLGFEIIRKMRLMDFLMVFGEKYGEIN